MRNKRPESVLVLVHTLAGEVLMLRRREPEGFWQSVTGSLLWGERAPQAARRELYEETGLQGLRPEDLVRGEVFPIIPPWSARYAPNVYRNREYWFRIALSGRRLVRLNPAEHLEYRWLPAAKAAALAASWTNRKAILQTLGTQGGRTPVGGPPESAPPAVS